MADNNIPGIPGVLMLDIQGQKLSMEERQLLSRQAVGGVILFSRNFSEPSQLRDLIREIRECKPEILLAVDQEGGRVQRFRSGFSRLPAPYRFSELFDRSPEEAVSLAHTCGWLMAAELLYFGLDLSFAPVLDLYTTASEVIGDRAFSAEVDIAVRLIRAYVDGMHEAGMVATGKHFPGHGTVVADSHVELPVDDRPESQIWAHDLKVFSDCIDVLDAVMPAHVCYPAIDQECAGYSSTWLQGILRRRLGFEGVIFSDDLNMEAAKKIGDAVTRAKKALSAGCDMVLVCNAPQSALQVADYLEASGHPGNPGLAKLRGAPSPEIASLFETDKWATAAEAANRLSE